MTTFSKRRVVLVLIGMLLAPQAVAGGAGRTLPSQTSREGAATVKVTPRNIAPGAKTWDFEVSMDTHSGSLDEDMTRAAALIDTSGRAQPPLAWEGAPPSGHHRKGVLRFEALPGSPASLELRIDGVGGVQQRVFRWRLSE